MTGDERTQVHDELGILKVEVLTILIHIPMCCQYAISQLRIVRSGLHLVTYLDVGIFWDKRIEKPLHEICVQGFLRFSDSNKPSQSVSLIYELA